MVIFIVDINKGETISSCPLPGLPVWSIAYQANLNCLAVGHSKGPVFLLNGTTLYEEAVISSYVGRPKRMKWFYDQLFFVNVTELMRYDAKTKKLVTHVESIENTIEDFIFNESYGYLILAGYRTELVLADLFSGMIIHTISDQADFTKGLCWLNCPEEECYPLDFLAYGRYGSLNKIEFIMIE